MSTGLASDRRLRVEEILGAFDMRLGATASGVAYGGKFITKPSGAPIDATRRVTGCRRGCCNNSTFPDCVFRCIPVTSWLSAVYPEVVASLPYRCFFT